MSNVPSIPKLKPGEALVLRTCEADMTSHGGFRWPRKGRVEAPDWNPDKTCGNGLHGLLWGEGDGTLMSFEPDATWLVCKVSIKDCVDLGGKVKFPACEVIYAGTRADATQLIALVNPKVAVEGLMQMGGDCATLTGGKYAKLTGGNFAKLTGGDHATLTGGNYTTLTGGDHSTMNGGDCAKLMGGDHATLTGGNYTTLTGGDHSTMNGGDCAKLMGGDHATLTGGKYSVLMGGKYAKLTGGDYSVLQFNYWDGKRTHIVVAYVGEDGIEANKPYCLNREGKVTEVNED